MRGRQPKGAVALLNSLTRPKEGTLLSTNMESTRGSLLNANSLSRPSAHRNVDRYSFALLMLERLLQFPAFLRFSHFVGPFCSGKQKQRTLSGQSGRSEVRSARINPRSMPFTAETLLGASLLAKSVSPQQLEALGSIALERLWGGLGQFRGYHLAVFCFEGGSKVGEAEWFGAGSGSGQNSAVFEAWVCLKLVEPRF